MERLNLSIIHFHWTSSPKAEVILRCHDDNSKRFELLGKIYEKQRLWAVGSDINKINNSIKKIANEFDLNNEQIDKCLKNEKYQDEILNQRIEAQKKYKIEATPTIFVNEKKYSGKMNINSLKIRKKSLVNEKFDNGFSSCEKTMCHRKRVTE